jgi:thioredoxin 1
MRKYLISALTLGALAAVSLSPLLVSSDLSAQTVTAPQTQTQSAVIKITSAAQFDDLVQKSTTPIIVDFKAVWCGPCHRFAPIFEQAAKDFNGKVTFVQVDVDDVPDLSNRYQIQYIPTIKLFNPGNTTPAAESGAFRDVNGIKGWLKAKANVVP